MAKQKAVKSGIGSLLNTPPTAETKTTSNPTPSARSVKPAKVDRRRSDDPTVMIGTAVKGSFKSELMSIAQSEGVAMNALVGFLVMDGYERYRAGKLKLPKVTVTVTRLGK